VGFLAVQNGKKFVMPIKCFFVDCKSARIVHNAPVKRE
jgi:hypothetical protein